MVFCGRRTARPISKPHMRRIALPEALLPYDITFATFSFHIYDNRNANTARGMSINSLREWMTNRGWLYLLNPRSIEVSCHPLCFHTVPGGGEERFSENRTSNGNGIRTPE